MKFRYLKICFYNGHIKYFNYINDQEVVIENKNIKHKQILKVVIISLTEYCKLFMC